MVKEGVVKLRRPLQRSEIQRLVYAKSLLFEGRRYLENNLVENYFNLSVVICANAVEILCQVIIYCVEGRDRTDEKISECPDSIQGV